MEMIAIEDIPVGQDLTPPLSQPVAALHDSAISGHCAACFSPLPTRPFHLLTQIPLDDTPSLLYCSHRCSSLDSSLHFSSAEGELLSLLRQTHSSMWQDSADLRLSLRLLCLFEKLNLVSQGDLRGFSALGNNDRGLILEENKYCQFKENKNIPGERPGENVEKQNQDVSLLERIAGLMTNREQLVFQENKNDRLQEKEDGEDPDEIPGKCNVPRENVENCFEKEVFLERIREGAKLMTGARRMHNCDRVDVNEVGRGEYVMKEMVLCLILTNAVEVQDKSGCCIGTAVYGPTFSWINHSCSPNARYRFSMRPETIDELQLRISPSAMVNDGGDIFKMIVEDRSEFLLSGREAYGPRLIARSIKAINKGEDVTIAYTDVFQPKKMRQSELWMKYRFNCGCKCCSAEPTTYVDCALQAMYAHSHDCFESISYAEPVRGEEIKNITDLFDDIIDEYLCLGDVKSCCEKLENLLSHGYTIDQLKPKAAVSQCIIKLHPFHHVTLKAYATLASAYKVRASDLLALDSGVDAQKLDAFNLQKNSVAYSLLVAGASHHLFMFESSLIASVANYWISAGQSMQDFANCSSWNLFPTLEPSSVLTPKCPECSMEYSFWANGKSSHDRSVQFEEITKQFYNCILAITSRVWLSLICESNYLKTIENPVDFSWLPPPGSSAVPSFGAHFTNSDMGKGIPPLEGKRWTDPDRTSLNLLGVHCLRYGAFLSGICYGVHSQ